VEKALLHASTALGGLLGEDTLSGPLGHCWAAKRKRGELGRGEEKGGAERPRRGAWPRWARERLGRRRPGGGEEEKRESWASLLFSRFAILCSFSISYYLKSNSLLNAYFTNSLIKQSGNILQHDTTIKAPLGFTSLVLHIYNKVTLHYLQKKKKSKE
jgi:hypothetical protein